MENNLPKLSLELRIGSASFEVNEPDGFIENEEIKDFEESKVEKSFASKGIDLLKMHETITNNVIASHNEIAIGIPNNPFPFTPGLVHHTYPCYSPLSKDFQVQKYKLMLG
ncbi:hypothetical protein F8M41_014905 [Gigaspora margarita]|uniref:Uncharacterized protein n=1 Tax=Gigaspora margarita TaxID=4874 RepID=A0A8H4AR07_GIGMA|nr:hypothetical protein F8M41_014905 [Gigaspora margarita]